MINEYIISEKMSAWKGLVLLLFNEIKQQFIIEKKILPKLVYFSTIETTKHRKINKY